MGKHRSQSWVTESGRLSATVGAASAAIPRQRASYWQAPIAAEAAPTTRWVTPGFRPHPLASGALDHTQPQGVEEPAGVTLGAGSVGEAAHRKKPEGGWPWMASRFR